MINEWYIYETSNDPTGYVVMKGKCGFELNNLNDAEALLKFLQELERENAKLRADLAEWMRCAEERLEEMQRLKAEVERLKRP